MGVIPIILISILAVVISALGFLIIKSTLAPKKLEAIP